MSISGFRVFGATNETFSVLGGSSYKLYISRRTSPWKLQPATILTDTNSMNFSQHSSYGQRNVPLHGPSPRAQANGVCKPGALQTCLSTPARLQGTSTPTPKRECPPPPCRNLPTPIPPPKPTSATIATAPAVPRLHEVLPVPDRAWFRRCAIRQEDAPDGCASPCGILYGWYASRVFSGAAAEVLWVAGGVCRRCRWGRGRGMSCVCVVGICGRAGWATALLSAKAGGEIRKGRWEALRGVGRCGGRGGMSGRDGWVVGARAYVACVEGRSVFVGARWGVFFWFVFEDF